MKNCLLILLLVISSYAKSQRLIVRGDDMGYSHSGNLALIDCFKNGFEKSIEVIVPSPWFPEAVKMLKATPGVDIGIHLALTSEWENVKWRPMSDCPSLKDSNGYFFPMVFANPNYPGKSIMENHGKLEDIEKEFRAQIETAMRLLPNITHLSSHMGCTFMTPEVSALTKELAKEYGIPVDAEPQGVQYISYNGPHKTPEEKITSFKKMLDQLEKGTTYLFLDHPGYNDAELKAIYHIGYEDVATDRQGVTDLFTNRELMELMRAKGIEVIGYGDLLK